MIKESAVVARVDNNEVWVHTQRRSTCGQCAAKSGCGSAALSEVLGTRRSTVRVVVDDEQQLNELQAQVLQSNESTPPETITIGLHEQQLLKGSLAVYAMPLLILFLGLVLGHVVAGETGALCGMGVAVMLSIAWLRWFNRRIQHDTNYQPRVVSSSTESL